MEAWGSQWGFARRKRSAAITPGIDLQAIPQGGGRTHASYDDPWPVARFELEAGRQPRGPATNVFHSLSGADNPPLPRGPISLPPPVVDHFVPLLLVKTIQRRYFRSHWNSIGARRLNSRENVGTSLANMKYLVVENHT